MAAQRRHLHRGRHAAAANRRGELATWKPPRAASARAMDGSRFRVVVNKSTVPVGCGNLVEALVREGIARSAAATDGGRIRFGVASNPEFLREGCAVADSLYPGPHRGRRATPPRWQSCANCTSRWSRSSLRPAARCAAARRP